MIAYPDTIKMTWRGKTFLALFMLLIFLLSFHQIQDSDTFYHIKTGQVILNSGRVPTADIFSYTAPGALWVTHEWLVEVIFYLITAGFGLWGLIGFAAFCIALSYFLVVRSALQKKANIYITLILGFIIACPLVIHSVSTSAAAMAALAFSLLVYCLEKYRTVPRVFYLALSVLIIWLWANMHASFLLGLVVITFYAIALRAQMKFPHWFGKARIDARRINYLSVAALVSWGAAFLNPNTYRIFFYVSYVREVAGILNITEYHSVLSLLGNPIAQTFLVEVVLSGLFLVWHYGVKEEGRDVVALGLFCGVSILPFIAIAYTIFWPFVVIAPLAVAASSILNRGTKKVLWGILFGLFAALGLFSLVTAIISLPRSPVDDTALPVKAVDFIKQNNIRGPLFNTYDDGGYLIWALWPQEKVAIDMRSEVFRGRPVQEYLDVMSAASDWKQIVDQEYGINYFVLHYWKQSISSGYAPLFEALSNDNFRMVYWDDNAVIMVRATPENENLIKEYGTSYVDPFVLPEDISTNLSQTEAELKALAARFPGVQDIQYFLARFLRTHGLQ